MDNEAVALDAVRRYVWSGMYDADEIAEIIDESVFEPGHIDRGWLQDEIRKAIREKRAEEETCRERQVRVLPGMTRLLQLDGWHYPNVVEGERPGETDVFQPSARVLATGDVSLYRPIEQPNTHWRNWPEGGRL